MRLKPMESKKSFIHKTNELERRDIDLILISRDQFRKDLDKLFWTHTLAKKLSPFGLKVEILNEALFDYHSLMLSKCGLGEKDNPLHQFKKIFFNSTSRQIHISEIYPVTGIKDNQGFDALKEEKICCYLDGEEIDQKTLKRIIEPLKKGGFKEYTYNDFMRKIDQSRRIMAPLLKNAFVSDKIKADLLEERERLYEVKQGMDQTVIDRPLHLSETGTDPQATSMGQMLGFQVYQLFEYLWELAEQYNEHNTEDHDANRTQVFEFISLLLNLGLNTKPYNGMAVKSFYERIYNRKGGQPKKI